MAPETVRPAVSFTVSWLLANITVVPVRVRALVPEMIVVPLRTTGLASVNVLGVTEPGVWANSEPPARPRGPVPSGPLTMAPAAVTVLLPTISEPAVIVTPPLKVLAPWNRRMAAALFNVRAPVPLIRPVKVTGPVSASAIVLLPIRLTGPVNVRFSPCPLTPMLNVTLDRLIVLLMAMAVSRGVNVPPDGVKAPAPKPPLLPISNVPEGRKVPPVYVLVLSR